MSDCSIFIVEAMSYVDKKIGDLDYKGIDRTRLHRSIKIQITNNAKRIADLEHNDKYREIDNIFRTKLLEELLKHL